MLASNKTKFEGKSQGCLESLESLESLEMQYVHAEQGNELPWYHI